MQTEDGRTLGYLLPGDAEVVADLLSTGAAATARVIGMVSAFQVRACSLRSSSHVEAAGTEPARATPGRRCRTPGLILAHGMFAIRLSAAEADRLPVR